MSWTVELSVNIESIDAQHRRLVDLLTEMHDAAEQGAGKETIGKILTEGLRLTAEHFKYEERLMREHGYASYESHKKEHEQLITSVKEMARLLAAGKRVNLNDVEAYLKDWWLNHIKNVDKAFGAFLVSRGVT